MFISIICFAPLIWFYTPYLILKSEGDIGVFGIAVLGFFFFFSCGISVILILTCSIAVSSSSARGMRFFIILADGIRWNNIVHGIAVPNIKIWGGHGGLRYCGIGLFLSFGTSVILIFTCGIAVSSSSAVCGFSSSWLTAFGEIRLFTVLRYGKWLHYLWVILWLLLVNGR